jgi:hypothetical protein
MKFPYSAFLSEAPDTGEEIIIFRPEVPLRLRGASGQAVFMALVDTGADNTIFPMSIARDLGIETQKAKGRGAVAFGGQEIPLSFADIDLQISDDKSALRWIGRVYFSDFGGDREETLIVGHEGFLDFFTASFDGEQTTLTLHPNKELPILN